MARERVGGDIGQFRFPDGTFARIEGSGEGRAEFVRAAVLDRLDRLGGVERPEPVAKRADRDFSGDYAVVLGELRGHRYSALDLGRKLGWAPMRVDKVLGAMERAGLVRFDRGVVEAA